MSDSNFIDRIATGESFISSYEEISKACDKYEKRFGPLVGVCEKCQHSLHEPGRCSVNVGTGYFGPVLCRCGKD